MTSHGEDSITEICARVKSLGYAASGRIRIYGQEFDVISDPFPEAGGVAVLVKPRGDPRVRALQLPATVLHSGKSRRRPLASAA